MIAAALIAALGGIVFVEQDIPEARSASSWLVQGDAESNFLRADLDGDGAVDLLFNSHVVFQRDGAFSREHRAELPEGFDTALRDVWNGVVYFRRPGRFTALRWANGAWEEVFDQAIDWVDNLEPPVADDEESDEESREESRGAEDEFEARSERFFHDLDGDGTPELIIPSYSDLHLYVKTDAGYVKTRDLGVLPPAEASSGGALWPEERRHIGYPSLWRRTWFLIEGNQVTVANTRTGGEDLSCLDVRLYRLDSGGAVLADENRTQKMALRQGVIVPAHLNGDGAIDYVAWDSGGLRMSPAPTPIIDIAVSTDGGQTSQAFRFTWYPRCLFVDFDGDGDMDLVSAATGVLRGGIRESVTRLFTQRTVDHELRVHLQDAHGSFSTSPDVRIPLAIGVDKPLFFRSDMAWRYAEAGLADLSGDFDGDGRVDLAVQDRPDRLAVFLNSKSGFRDAPDAVIATRPDRSFGIADIDEDGRSDVATFPWDSDDSDDAHDGRIYLTRGSSP